MNSSQLGNIGESVVLTAFTKMGIQCFIPYGDGSSTDLIAEFNNKLNRIQVKTTIEPKAEGYMLWKIGHQASEKRGNSIAYSANEVDYFALYCVSNDSLFLVPFNENDASEEFRIWPTQNQRKSRKHIATDFDFSTKLSQIVAQR